MTSRINEKPSQRRSDASPTRQATNYRERSTDRYQKTDERQNSNKNGIVKDIDEENKECQETIEKEQNERGRKLEKDNKDQEAQSEEGGNNEENDEMMKLMGFGSFGTTNNKKVQGQVTGAVKKNKKTQFRQYMNREKGFNRALSPDRKGKSRK